MELVSRFALLLSFLASGCASTSYYFAPKPRTDLTPAGMLGATYSAPGEKKDSSLRILPLGVRNSHGRKVVPVRYYLENNGAEAWKLEPARQKITFPGGAEIAAEPSADSYEGKITEVPKGVVRIWDVEFPVPAGISSSTDIEHFELVWEIGAPFPFAGRTKFVPTETRDENVLTNPSAGRGARKNGVDRDHPADGAL